MAKISSPTLTELTEEAILSATFERLRPRLLAMIDRRIGRKLAARVDPEGVVQDSFIRARRRWNALIPKPTELDAWVYSQVLDRLIELIRSALGPEHDVDRDVAWPAASVDSLVDSQTGPTSRCRGQNVARPSMRP